MQSPNDTQILTPSALGHTNEEYREAITNLINHGAHFGHKRRSWNPKMKKYAYKTINGIDIINLDKTVQLLKKAEKAVFKMGVENSNIMLVGCKPSASEVIKRLGEEHNIPYVNHRWTGGCLTNWKTIRLSILRMLKMKERIEKEESEEGGTMTKMELLKFKRNYQKLYVNLNGLRNLERPPANLIVVDANRESIALAEARKMGKKIVGMVDTNSNPEQLDFAIPVNDDSSWVTDFILTSLLNCYQAGKAKSES